jgi:hypothetical protein
VIVAGVDSPEVTGSPVVERGQRHVLVMRHLSLAGAAELAKRVRAGEEERAVRVELLLREGKAVEG